MLQYDRIDLPEQTDVNKTNSLRKCIICHYWYFLEIHFKFQPKVCGSCHNSQSNVTRYEF